LFIASRQVGGVKSLRLPLTTSQSQNTHGEQKVEDEHEIFDAVHAAALSHV
jgi:hypothetical protein